MTIKEIAALAGVSPSTVSRVINHPTIKVASKAVEDRIWKIVQEYHYVPNPSARNLRIKKKEETSSPDLKSIACVMARSLTSDPFFAEIARSIEQEAFRLGYRVKYIFSLLDINEKTIKDTIATMKVDGIAILGRFQKETLVLIKKYFKRVVYTGLNPIDTKYDQVICNGYEASKTAMEYLISLGHQKIAYIGERNNETRYHGYVDTLQLHNLSVQKDNIINTTLSSEEGYQATKKLLEQNPHVTALFCANDLTAIGALKAVRELGLLVPNDLSIIGIDDIETSQFVSPMLTTIRIPMSELGTMTAKLLIDRIQCGKRISAKIELPHELIRRQSCGPAVTIDK